MPGRRRALVEYVVEHSLLLAVGSAIALVWANTSDADRYYRVARPGHNLDRCRTQLALLDALCQQEHPLRRRITRI